MGSPELFRVLETYYDTAPRASARVEELGPFTLFARADPAGWPFYARPRLGLDAQFTAADVVAVQERQRELGIPQTFEWVHETTSTLLEAAQSAGLAVHECPLLVLDGEATAPPDLVGGAVHRMDPDAADLAEVLGSINSGFAEADEVTPRDPGPLQKLLRDGLVVVFGAYDASGVVGGGSHSPRGSTTELTGIAVLPRARRRGIGAAITHGLVSDARERGVETIFLSADDDAVARVYEGVGFVRVGTACIAEAPQPAEPPDDAPTAVPDRPVRIEPIAGDDWERWRAIRLRSLQDAPNAFGSTYERESAFAETDFRHRLGVGGPAFLALAGDQPIGLGAGFQDVEGWLLVVAMWVDPAWRGRGVGWRVLDAIVGWSGEHGLRAHLDVEAENGPARRLYERYGFVPTGETDVLRPGSSLIIERMVLPS